MNSTQTLLLGVFSVIIIIVLLGMVVNMMNNGINFKMHARLDHLADDIANAVQHMSSSTIDQGTQTLDVDIIGVDISIDENFTNVIYNTVTFSQSIHIAEGIDIVDGFGAGEVIEKICFVKTIDHSAGIATITVMNYPGSECDTEYKYIDLKYDFDWGFDGLLQIDGEEDVANSPLVNVVTPIPFGKIKDVAFHNFNINNPANLYIQIIPQEITKSVVKFDIDMPFDPLPATANNYADVTIDISPLSTAKTDVFFFDGPMNLCSNINNPIPLDCMEIVSNTEIRFTTVYLSEIRLVNNVQLTDFYNFGFFYTRKFDENTVYPNNTVIKVEFYHFVTPAQRYIEITPGDFDRNYFKFDVFVPEDTAATGEYYVSFTLDISPFYAENINIYDGDKIFPQCILTENSCYTKMGSKILLNLEHTDDNGGNYNFRIEDPLY